MSKQRKCPSPVTFQGMNTLKRGYAFGDKSWVWKLSDEGWPCSHWQDRKHCPWESRPPNVRKLNSARPCRAQFKAPPPARLDYLHRVCGPGAACLPGSFSCPWRPATPPGGPRPHTLLSDLTMGVKRDRFERLCEAAVVQNHWELLDKKLRTCLGTTWEPWLRNGAAVASPEPPP